MKPIVRVLIILCLFGVVHWQVRAASQIPAWGNGVAPFALAFIGDMPYGAAMEPRFERLVAEINRDNDVDFVMHAGDIKAGSEPCSDALIRRRFEMYQTFRRAFVYTPGDNEWTDCHRFNNGSHNPLDRLAFVRGLFFPQIGQTTGGQIRPVASQAGGAAFSEFVENVMFIKQDVMFATLHVVGSNNGIAPWNSQPNPFDPGDTCATPRIDRIQEFNRRKAAALDWLEQIFDAADGTRALFLMIQANPDNPPAAGCPNGFTEIMNALASHAAEYGKPVMLAHGDDHFFFIDQPLPNLLFSRVQTYGEFLVHWLKVHVDPKSSGVFSIEQKIVRSNL